MPATASSRRGVFAAAAATAALSAGVASAQQTVNGTYYPGTDWTTTYDPSIVPSPNSTETVHTRMLTPDGFWHNRYHGLLSMAAYGDYNTLCPIQTFDEENLRKNFPNSDREPWVVVNTFGPTQSGAQGFTAIVPEMNKALIIFQGNYELEQQLTDDVVGWDYLGLGEHCRSCTVNRFAAQGYMEAKNETNDWADILGEYYNTGLVFSIAGHGLGGMHSQIASVDLNYQGHCWYSHAYGSPRVFNQAGVDIYNAAFNGEAGERGVAGNDQYTEFIPAGPNYAHAGTTFLYWGLNRTSGNPNWHICWDNNEDPECKPGAQPQQWRSTAEEDHYFYFSNVGQCGGRTVLNSTIIDDFINSDGQQVDADPEYATASGDAPASTSYYYQSSSSSSNYYYQSTSSSSYRASQQTAALGGPAAAATGSSSRGYGYPPAGPAGPSATY